MSARAGQFLLKPSKCNKREKRNMKKTNTYADSLILVSIKGELVTYSCRRWSVSLSFQSHSSVAAIDYCDRWVRGEQGKVGPNADAISAH